MSKRNKKRANKKSRNQHNQTNRNRTTPKMGAKAVKGLDTIDAHFLTDAIVCAFDQRFDTGDRELQFDHPFGCEINGQKYLGVYSKDFGTDLCDEIIAGGSSLYGVPLMETYIPLPHPETFKGGIYIIGTANGNPEDENDLMDWWKTAVSEVMWRMWVDNIAFYEPIIDAAFTLRQVQGLFQDLGFPFAEAPAGKREPNGD